MSGSSPPESNLSVSADATDDRGTRFSRRRLVVVGLVVCLAVSAVGFAQAMSGYFATHQASFAEVSVLGVSDLSDGRVTVDLAVENPTTESLTVHSYRLAGYVEGEPVLGEGRRVLEQPTVVPPGERQMLSLSVAAISDRVDSLGARRIKFDGRLAVHVDEHRQLLSIDTGGTR